MSRSSQLPVVAHIVADLDDLAVAVPQRGTGSLARWVSSMFRRALRHSRAYLFVTMSALLLAIIACSDSDDPMTVPGPVPVATVAVSPAAQTLHIGQTAALTATLRDAAGNVLSGRVVRWNSSNPTISTVSENGLVTALAVGVATITAESGGRTGQAQITVSLVPVARVGVTPTAVVLPEGQTRQLTAVAFDAAGNVLEGRTVEWSTDAPQVATVSATGLVRAVARGYADITATIEGKSATGTITVPTPEPTFEYDLVYERRTFNQAGDVRRLSLSTGGSTTLPLVATIPGTFVRDVSPSPDGARVAFTVAWYPEGTPTLDSDIYVANIDGTGLRRLTTTEEVDDQPAWSPDGTRIAFRSYRSGNPDIWVMAADGTGQVNLTNDALPAVTTEHGPAWSPDGSRIAFASDYGSYAYTRLWTMRPDGSDKRRVLPFVAGPETDMEPSWSPDGTRIAFRRVSDNRATNADIMIATIATRTVSRVALDGWQGHPAWSPDGSMIAFSSDHQGLLAHIYTMRPDGTDIVRHTVGDDQNIYPRWIRSAAAGVKLRR